jgi:hypothetical protein
MPVVEKGIRQVLNRKLPFQSLNTCRVGCALSLKSCHHARMDAHTIHFSDSEGQVIQHDCLQAP